jgi:ADP-ribosylglycohydrolase
MSQGLSDKYAGAMLGLAVCDAVGTTVEFEDPGSFPPVTDMVGGGPFGLQPGEWTDDTSMALCLAASLTERKAFDAHDQMVRYVDWYRKGYMSSNGKCFDIGNTVRAALHSFESSGNPFAGSSHPQTAGNGSLMRLAPVPLAYRADPAKAVEFAGLSSRTTHGARVAVDACRYFAALIVGALNGATKNDLLGEHYSPVAGYWTKNPLCDEIAQIARGSFKTKQPPAIKGSGYAAHALEAALWAFHNSTDFKDGCLLAVNLGDDADTTAAIFGQIAGAFYGAAGIPARWTAKVAKQAQILSLADELFKLSSTVPPTFVASADSAKFAVAVAAKQEMWKSDKTQTVIATDAILALPTAVALAKQNGLQHVLALTFDGSSYTRPSGPQGIHPSECKPEWLHAGTAAKMVFDYCQAVGLKANIAAHGNSFRQQTFAIYAAW